MSWDQFFIDMATLAERKSKDRSTGIGVVLVGPGNEVLSIGYNGFPRKVDDNIDARHERPAKYMYTEHAERNAVFNAARIGVVTLGARAYMSWEPFPCPDCARAFIQAGIKEIIGPARPFPGKHWQDTFPISRQMLEEAGVLTRIVGGPQ